MVRARAFTNEQASRGVYKEAGACALTRVRDGIKDSNIRYTKCDGCKATMCSSCLDLIADAVLELANERLRRTVQERRLLRCSRRKRGEQLHLPFSSRRPSCAPRNPTSFAPLAA